MSRTYHEMGTEAAMMSSVKKIPEMGSLLFGYLERLRNGGFHSAWVDAVVQHSNSRPSKPTLADAFVFVQLDALFISGKLGIWTGKVRSGPGGDHRDDLNNEILGGLPGPFTVRFVGGDKQSADGFVSWDEPVEFDWYPDGIDNETGSLMMPPDRVPLEVGTTQSSVTLVHVLSKRGVARWPYDNSVVTILKYIPDYIQIRERGWAAEGSL